MRPAFCTAKLQTVHTSRVEPRRVQFKQFGNERFGWAHWGCRWSALSMCVRRTGCRRSPRYLYRRSALRSLRKVLPQCLLWCFSSLLTAERHSCAVWYQAAALNFFFRFLNIYFCQNFLYLFYREPSSKSTLLIQLLSFLIVLLDPLFLLYCKFDSISLVTSLWKCDLCQCWPALCSSRRPFETHRSFGCFSGLLARSGGWAQLPTLRELEWCEAIHGLQIKESSFVPPREPLVRMPVTTQSIDLTN